MRLDLSSIEGSRFFLINHTRLDRYPFGKSGELRYSLSHTSRESL